MTFKILVCGGRDYQDEQKVFDTLDPYLDVYGGHLEIISGMARGADTFGHKYATLNELTNHKFPADWDKHGRAAGPIRNQQMLDEGKPDLVIAFGGGTGTAHMIRISRKVGVEVIEIDRETS